MSVKGAVLDMDGLMFDTENLTYRLQRELLEKEGLSVSLDDYKQTIGKRVADLEVFFKDLFGYDFDMTDFRAKCREAFAAYTDRYGVPIKDGLFDLLDYLRNRGIKTALCTSTSTRSAERMLRIAGVYEYFDELVCAEDVKSGKPHPEPFLKAAQKLGLAPEDCIALEDSINGIISAHEAGMVTVMVPDLIEPTDDIIKLCAAVCGNLSEVKAYV